MTAQNIIKLYTEKPTKKNNSIHFCIGADYTRMDREEIQSFANILQKVVNS